MTWSTRSLTRTLRHTSATSQASIGPSTRCARKLPTSIECSKRHRPERACQSNIMTAAIAMNGASTTIVPSAKSQISCRVLLIHQPPNREKALIVSSDQTNGPSRVQQGLRPMRLGALASGGEPAPPHKRTNSRLVPQSPISRDGQRNGPNSLGTKGFGLFNRITGARRVCAYLGPRKSWPEQPIEIRLTSAPLRPQAWHVNSSSRLKSLTSSGDRR
jgi:hypothetical protein